MDAKRWLILILRFEGVIMLAALAVVFFPDSWLEAGHRLAGLGDYPRTFITEYLARSLSLLYGGVGFFVLVLSSDLTRYRQLILYMGAGHLVLSPMLVLIDLQSGAPARWAVAEGSSTAIVGTLILLLAARLR